ncbi:hypothetical protein DFJ43DRAFT_713197 [Lentinula guzmanii]|uniref:Uncharacterized protein n=1 Tax=Lentinula guzmanii TaxID=2804957 RepID=A0AA38J4S6_9AGAR|nr:hypothetical protein DFJ43DRAFT_713197 [Lentinula guzmanii]
MPAPAVYVIAVLGTVAVGFAFKEFVYDPHIAPKVAQWRHDYTSRKEARRRRRMPVAVSVSVDHDPNSESDDDSSKRGQSGGFEMESLNPSQTRIRARTVSKEGIESWRTGIQSVISATSLRKRNHTGTIQFHLRLHRRLRTSPGRGRIHDSSQYTPRPKPDMK